MRKILVGVYESEKSRREYIVFREIMHIDSNAKAGDNSCDIELYQTQCGMTLYFPDDKGALFCAELGENLVPKIAGSNEL